MKRPSSSQSRGDCIFEVDKNPLWVGWKELQYLLMQVYNSNIPKICSSPNIYKKVVCVNSRPAPIWNSKYLKARIIYADFWLSMEVGKHTIVSLWSWKATTNQMESPPESIGTIDAVNLRGTCSFPFYWPCWSYTAWSCAWRELESASYELDRDTNNVRRG